MWFWPKSRTERTGNTAAIKGHAGACPAGFLRSLSAAELLQPHQGLLYQLQELAGVTEPVFHGFYQAALINFARFVQQLPASEVHHHAGPGGLLLHSLEVAVLALKIRRSYLFSAEGGAEEIARKADLWTYAVFVGALCHDLAKPVMDQQVDVVTQPGQPGRAWLPFQQYIDEQGGYYQTRFIRDRRYRLHEKAAPLLIYRIVPLVGLEWLRSDPAIFTQWLATLAGDLESADAIGTLVHQADGQSVARNLGAGSDSAQRLSTVKTISLPEKILTALRHLLSNGELPLNRNGAAAWIYGGDCWLVSKRAVDTVRNHLLQEGHSGIPTQNSRFYDSLQEQGLLLPCGDKAIWRAVVKGEGWQNTLTVIRIPVAKLWINPESQPDAFAGQVLPEAADLSANDDEGQPVTKTDAEPEAVPSGNAGLALRGPTLSVENVANDDIAVAEGQKEFCSRAKHAQADSVKSATVRPDTFVPVGLTGLKPEPKANIDKAGSASIAVVDADHRNRQDLADAFVAWIQKGLQYRTLVVNHADAKLHVVPEGLLLVTPSIFQQFATLHQVDWMVVQKNVLQKGWHQRTIQGLNVFKYQVTGRQQKSTVNGVLFPDPTHWFGAVAIPLVNPFLTQLT